MVMGPFGSKSAVAGESSNSKTQIHLHRSPFFYSVFGIFLAGLVCFCHAKPLIGFNEGESCRSLFILKEGIRFTDLEH